MPRRAYSYLRLSFSLQLKGDGQRRQLEFAEQICKRRGWQLDDSFVLEDKGVSAFRGRNAKVGALAEFLAAIDSGRVSSGSILIVESIDRLSRDDIDEAYDLFRRIIKAGITIVTREPEREYDRESCSNVIGLLEPLFIMARSNEESKVKSMRAGEAWDTKRRQAAAERRPFGKRCPRWVSYSDSDDSYRLKPDGAKAIQQIFRLARDGMGTHRIAKWLRDHPHEYPPLGKTSWSSEYVWTILTGRAVLGEYQPRRRGEGNERPTEGQPIAGYYPAVVTEQEWYEAQAAICARKRSSGRPGAYEGSLFTGRLYCARTGERYCLQSNWSKGHRYQYLRIWKGHANPIRYDLLEAGVVESLGELRPADVLGDADQVNELESRIGELTGALIALDHRKKLLQEQLADISVNAEVAALADVLRQVATQHEDTAAELQRLKLEARSGRTETLGEMQSLLELLQSADEKERGELRRRVKARLRHLVDEIWVLDQPLTRQKKILHVQMFLRNGGRKYCQILPSSPPVEFQPWDLSTVDLRQWRLEQARPRRGRAASATGT